MFDKNEVPGDSPQLNASTNGHQSSSNSSNSSLNAAKAGQGLQQPVVLLQVPFRLQYQGSSPRKHVKGSNRASSEPTLSTPLRQPGYLIFRPTILASATAAAAAPPNHNPTPLVRITSTTHSPEPEIETKREHSMDRFDIQDHRNQTAGAQGLNLPSFESMMSGPSPFLLQGPTGATAGTSVGLQTSSTPGHSITEPLSRPDFQQLLNDVQWLSSTSSTHDIERKFAIPLCP